MIKTDGQSRLFCIHSIPTDHHCSDCEKLDGNYRNRFLNVSQPKSINNVDKIKATFPGDFKSHAHRFTRSFSWKTKGEESPFAQMQPLPKLVKKPGYVEICLKNICWPTHQLCLCCGRNTAESCRKWSKSTGEYDYIDACWSSCALCSNDALKIFNTPIVYHEHIIDPELLLPLDAELLYYSIQSAKRQQRNSSAASPVDAEDKSTTEENKPPVVPLTETITTPARPPATQKKSPKKAKSRRKKKTKTRKSSKTKRRSRSKSKSKPKSKSKKRSKSKSKKKRSKSKSKSKKRSKSKPRKKSKSKSKKRSKSKSRKGSKRKKRSKSKSKKRSKSRGRKRSKSKKR